MIRAEYIESGTYQGSEEEASMEGISSGDEVVIMTVSDYNSLKRMLDRYFELTD